MNNIDSCEGCGNKDLFGGTCPLCCPHSYSPGSEECSMCYFENECSDTDSDFL